MKQLLRRVLGRSCLNYEELITVLCDCESVINARPLTYVSNDPKDLVPLTPSMFLRDLAENGLPDYDTVDKISLSRKLRHKQKLRDDLRRRFRSEYLGQLKLTCNGKFSRPVTVGEVVLIGNDNDKRLDWPLGRIAELLPGKDNETRLVRVQTARGQLLRPLQRIYPLECVNGPEVGSNMNETLSANEGAEATSEEKQVLNGDVSNDASREFGDSESAGVFTQSRVPVVTRSGRVARLPKRFL